MRIRRFLVPVLGVIALIAMAAPKASAQSITCSSDNGKRNYCAVNTSGGVTLVRQRSGSACTQGYSWGFDRRGIWVDHGCRADFAIRTGYRPGRPGGPGYGPGPGRPVGQSITCSSNNGRRNYCPIGTRGRVSMVRQRSDARCTEGYSWGSDRRGIWVDHGCRADFVVR